MPVNTITIAPDYDSIRALLAKMDKVLCADGDIVDRVKMRDIKKGEFFKRKADAKKVYIRGEYCRSTRKYIGDDTDDISREILIKGDALVYVGFTY